MRGALLLTAWLLAPGAALAAGLFERNHPLVEEGLEAYDRGDFEAALKSFEAAKEALPGSAQVEFNRANALYKLGRMEEAKDAYEQLLGQLGAAGDGELKQKDFYNLGTALAQLGKTQEAVKAYRRALRLNPNDQEARHNLEVLLRKLPPPKTGAEGQDGGIPDGGNDGGEPEKSDGGRSTEGGRDGGQDGGQDGAADGGRGKDGGEDAGSSEGSQGRDAGDSSSGAVDGGQRDGGESDGGESESQGGGEVEQGDGGTPAQLSKKETEALLDAMKQNEKNLQMWRFQPKKPRKQNEKDW